MQAQDRDTTLRLIVGGGPAVGGFGGVTPAYIVGIERKPASASITFRLSMAYWEAQGRPSAPYPQSSRSVGVELVGIRRFGARRVQPYVFAGAGLYSRRTQGYGTRFTASDSGFVTGSRFPYNDHQLLPAFMLGTGASTRVGAATLFGELRLPLYYGNAFHWGPHPPLLFGIRF